MSNDVTDADKEIVRQVRQLLLAVLAVPVGPLEHAVQLAHESTSAQRNDPPEIFEEVGVSRQALRMFWHFRCNLESVMPPEGRG
jgi:hypothetical protein